MKRSVVIFEAEGGNDKGPDGHRPDSRPVLEALRRRGLEGELCFYALERDAALRERFGGKAAVAISRVNPGNLEDTDRYWQFLQFLSRGGTLVQTHPEVMSLLCFKDIFYKLRGTSCVPATTDFYYSYREMQRRLPLAALSGPRVLKKNFTSTGVGVWRIEQMADHIACTEAVDNRDYRFGDWTELFRFLQPVFHEQLSSRPFYFRDRQGILDVPFLPGIREGEVRIFFVRDKPVHILHKQPQADSFSATLFSGARYTADAQLGRWKPVVDFTLFGLEELRRRLDGGPLPVIWSIDSIPNRDGTYFFSDINAASVGFTSPGIVERLSELIADAICGELDGEHGTPPF